VKRAFVLSALVLWFACASNVFGAIKVSVTYTFGSGPIVEGGSSTTSVHVLFENNVSNRQVLNGTIYADKTLLTLPEPPHVYFATLGNLGFGIFDFNASGTFVYMHPGDAIRSVVGTAQYKLGSNTTTVNFSSALNYLTVSNVLPEITLTSPAEVAEDDVFALHVSATDPGGPHTFTYAWDLDNDDLFDDATGPDVQHSFSLFGHYELGVQVRDGEGGLSEGSVWLTVLEPSLQPPPEVVPEPSTLVIWGVGGLCAAAGAALRRRRTARTARRARWSDETRNAVFAVIRGPQKA
jgi:hypothetical protein